MEYHLLLPTEAATLLGTSPDTVRGLIDAGKLGAFRDHSEWLIPLHCLSTYEGVELEVDAARALSSLLDKNGDFARTVVADPEAVDLIEHIEHPPGSVGACLKQALVMFRRARPEANDPSGFEGRAGTGRAPGAIVAVSGVGRVHRAR